MPNITKHEFQSEKDVYNFFKKKNKEVTKTKNDHGMINGKYIEVIDYFHGSTKIGRYAPKIKTLYTLDESRNKMNKDKLKNLIREEIKRIIHVKN